MLLGFPGGSVVKNPPASARDTRDVGSVPGLERSPGGGNGNPHQYSCLENPLDKEVHGVAKNQAQMSAHTRIHTLLLSAHLFST